jgi:hypothetical protein
MDKPSIFARLIRSTPEPKKPVPEDLGEGAAKEAAKKLEGRRGRLEREINQQTK